MLILLLMWESVAIGGINADPFLIDHEDEDGSSTTEMSDMTYLTPTRLVDV